MGKKKTEATIRSSAAEYLTFVASTGDSAESFEMRYEDENIWLTQKMMAALYDVSKQTISQHIQRIYEDGKLLPEATVKKYLTVQPKSPRTFMLRLSAAMTLDCRSIGPFMEDVHGEKEKRNQHPLQRRFVYRGRIAAVSLGRVLDIGQDGAGDKLCLVPPLLFQKLRRHPLLGVLHVELQGEPARFFLLSHAGHLLFWAIRYSVS